jgi:hypothetical protein
MVGTNLQTMIKGRAIYELLEIAASQRHRNDIPLQQVAFRLCRLYDAENVLARLQPWVAQVRGLEDCTPPSDDEPESGSENSESGGEDSGGEGPEDGSDEGGEDE